MKITFALFDRYRLRWLAWLLLSGIVALQVACATGPRLINHTFEFDARWDSPGVEIIDYQYGNSNTPGVRGCPTQYSPCSKSRQYAGTTGKMLPGDSLYVKWRIKSTSEVYDDTVDLKSRLPEDIANNRIHFIIKGSQLYVYLITPERLHPNPCPRRDQLCRIMDPSCPSADHRIFSWYCSKNITRLYPGQAELLNIKVN